MKRFPFALVQIAVVVVVTQGCNKSLMPAGFEELKLGEPIDQLVQDLAKDPEMAKTMQLTTPGLGPARSWNLSGSPAEMLEQMYAHRAEYQKNIQSLGDASPFVSASQVSDLDYFRLVVGPSHGFKTITFEFTKPKGSGVLLKQVTFGVEKRDVALHEEMVAQAQQKIGRKPKRDSDSGPLCHEDSASWMVCEKNTAYEVNRWDCSDHTGGIDVKLSTPYEVDCRKNDTPKL